ncbi:hypothetical protein [Streptosporangium sp. NPDC049304]|uniref:hypothetical protein n=1 Tax=Streptosporangium sp. NPDC049304 TaxID=3154830 RepID=UPI00342FF424
MTSPDDLEARLLALGESIDVPSPPPDDVARAVRARLRSQLAPATPAPDSGTPTPEAPTAPASPAPEAPAVPGGPVPRDPVPETGTPEAPAVPGGPVPRDPVPETGTPEAPAVPGGPRVLRRAWEALRDGGRVRRRAVVAAVAILTALLLGATPAGRAAVAEILRFAGVELRVGGPGPLPSGVPQPLPGERRVTMEQAREQVAFPISVPAALGDPAEVRVSDGGRVVSLFWPGLRLDEYDGSLHLVFRKELGPPWPEETGVGGVKAEWIPAHHGLTYLPRSGGEAEIRPRSAGPTLIWQRERVGLRLEGVGELGRAQEIARSVR